MRFLERVKKLQSKNEGSIVIVKNGAFFIGIGKDAIALHEIFGIKLICFRNEMCKAGIPIKSIEKYAKQLKEKDYSCVIYIFENEEPKEIFRHNGNPITNTKECMDCENCENKKYSEKDVIERVMKLGQE